MKRYPEKMLALLIALLFVFPMAGCQSPADTLPADMPAAEETLPEAPVEESAAQEESEEVPSPEVPVVSSYSWGGYALSIEAYEDHAVIAYPEAATEDDVALFLSAEAEKHGIAGVYYAFQDDGTLRLDYPAIPSEEDRMALCDTFASDLISYVGGDPSGLAVVSEYSYAGYDLLISAYDGHAVISYPEEAADDDVSAFLAAEAARYGISGVYYSFQDDGTLLLEYPEGIAAAERRALSDTLASDLIEYVTYVPEAVAEAPAEMEAPAEEAPAEPAEVPVSSEYSYAGYALSIDAYDGYAVISYPEEATDDDVSAFLAAEAARYGTSGVYYSFQDDGTLLLEYPEGIAEVERKALSDTLASDLIEYVTYVPEAVADAPAKMEEPAEEAPAEPAEAAVAEVPATEPETFLLGVEPVVKSSGDTDGFELYIVHTNDVHGRIEEGTDGSMGYAKLSTLLSMGRELTPDILLLDAGDTLHGTNLVNMFEGQTALELMDMLGYDAMAPGNHDFNYGSERLSEAADWADDNASFRILSANITYEDSGAFAFQPYQLYDFNGFRVCVIGLTTPDTKTKSHPKNTEGLDFISDDILSNAQAAIDYAGDIADFVIVLGHIGVVDDGEYGITSPLICQSLDGIDLFIDGHSHTVMDGGEMVNGTLIVSTGNYLDNAGIVRVDVAADGSWEIGDAFLLPAAEVTDPSSGTILSSYGVQDVPSDPAVSAYIEERKGELDSLFGEVIANVPMDLNGERGDVRTHKTNLSKLVCDAITEESGADFTIVNGGGIRASISAGPVTAGDINNVLPFTNIITVCEISPADIYAALEHGYSVLPEENGAFPQTDLRIVYSASAPAGERIRRVYLGSELLDRNDTESVYHVATNDFMAAGGDGYTMFGRKVAEGSMLNEVFMSYLSARYPVF